MVVPVDTLLMTDDFLVIINGLSMFLCACRFVECFYASALSYEGSGIFKIVTHVLLDTSAL